MTADLFRVPVDDSKQDIKWRHKSDLTMSLLVFGRIDRMAANPAVLFYCKPDDVSQIRTQILREIGCKPSNLSMETLPPVRLFM
jgi:hypothetical protein